MKSAEVLSFQSLIVWQKGHQFVLDIYRITRRFPKDERFGIVSQMRRAAISITANIAEGYRKFGKKDKLRFFNISQGSLAEIYNYLILAKDLQYISQNDYDLFQVQLIELDKLLRAYCAKISKDIQPSNF
ncbi:four helix bundle protein [Proteiniphilum acetatigenes]|uniref:four helix bundle protein n=1 Tax=Proteiniphilum acetatigenes TaxID=294710 RepID=UPI000380FDB2|nr:four helix bundle protein [Proteiniphilum acetatigenes]SFK96689.1 four helix bundle protein [Porphyromonadaceae bacterium KH3CP3RA]